MRRKLPPPNPTSYSYLPPIYLSIITNNKQIKVPIERRTFKMLFSLRMFSSPAPPVAAARMQKQHNTLTLKPNNINTQISSSSSPFLIGAALYPKRRTTTSPSLFSPKFSKTSSTSPKYLNVNPLTSFWPPSSSNSSSSSSSSPPVLLKVRAMKKLQGKVVCATNDKTVSVEVTRLAPHPKYKRRIRYKKKYQAHDPENRFKVGDYVQLESSRPISKTKSFIALPLSSKKPNLLEAQLTLTLILETASSSSSSVSSSD